MRFDSSAKGLSDLTYHKINSCIWFYVYLCKIYAKMCEHALKKKLNINKIYKNYKLYFKKTMIETIL